MKPTINPASIQEIDCAFDALSETENIMKDGMICPDRYAGSHPRVMWILKQNIDLGYSSYDSQLLQNLGKVSSSPTWRRMAHASHGILSGNRDFPSVKFHEKADCIESLASTAIVNVNKELGESRSSDGSVHEGYAKYKDLVKMQILALDPDVIIVGMVGANENLKPIVESLYKDYTGESEYSIHGNSKPESANVAWSKAGNKVFLWAYHPSYPRISDNDYFAGIMNAYLQATNQ